MKKNIDILDIKKMFKRRPTIKIINIDKNKHGEDVIVGITEENIKYIGQVRYSSTIYIFEKEDVDDNRPPLMNISIDIENQIINIIDIYNRYNSIGNGTILMKTLIKIAKEKKIKKIKGKMYEDGENNDRIGNFYKKFNFSITLEEGIKKIELIL